MNNINHIQIQRLSAKILSLLSDDDLKVLEFHKTNKNIELLVGVYAALNANNLRIDRRILRKHLYDWIYYILN